MIVGLNEIKYYLSLDEVRNSPIISISVDDVLKIVLSSGREIEFNDPRYDPGFILTIKNEPLNFHFLSPLLEHFAFT